MQTIVQKPFLQMNKKLRVTKVSRGVKIDSCEGPNKPTS